MGFEDQMRQIARQMIAKHGDLVEVRCVSGNNPCHIELMFSGGEKLVVGQHSGHVDISMIKAGYHGTGSRCFHAFLDEAGFDVTFDQIVNMKNDTVLQHSELKKENVIQDEDKKNANIKFVEKRQTPQCAKCMEEFDWAHAYTQQDTPGSHMHNPPGHGDFRPRAFCTNCGFLVAEWDIDRHQDRDRWKWYGENAKVNDGRELPPSPILGGWGRPIPSDARVTVPKDHIDVNLVRRLLGESAPEEKKLCAEEQEVSCPKCGSSKFEYDSYRKEYTCKNCGWILEDNMKISALNKIRNSELKRGNVTQQAVVAPEVRKPVTSFPYFNSLTVSPHNEDVGWISRWEAGRFSVSVLSSTDESPRFELEFSVRQKPSGYVAICRHVSFLANGRLLVTFPLEKSLARLVILDAESGRELSSRDIPDIKLHTLVVNNAGDTIAAQIDGKNLLVVSITGDTLAHSVVQAGETYGPTPYFAPDGRLYAYCYGKFVRIEGDQAVHVVYTKGLANSIAFDLAGKVYFGKGFSDRSADSSLLVVDLDSCESSEIPWGREPIDVIVPLGDDKLLIGNWVNEVHATKFPISYVSLFRVSLKKKEWTIKITDISPNHAPVLLSVPEEGWALLQSGRLLKRVSLENGEVLEEFPKEKNEFVQARWLGSQRMLCVSRNRSKSDAGTLEFYKIA